jgi:TonB family protein
MTTLLLKITGLFLTGLLALLISRQSSAAMRHRLCVYTLAGSLFLPFAALLPPAHVSFRLFSLGANDVTSRPVANVAGLPARDIFFALWALGTVCLLLRLALGYWRIHQLIRRAEVLEPGLYAADVNVPIAFGFLKPLVLLPRFAAEWPDWQRAAALRHERAHIERKDLLANLIAHLACALYWFHPLVWVLSALLRREQESACDDAVLQGGFDSATYAEALLAVAQTSTSTLLAGIPGCPMTTQTNLKTRIMRLLDNSIARTTSRVTMRRIAIVFAILFLAIGIQVRADQVYKSGGDVISPRVIQKVDPQYTDDARRDKISGTVVLAVVVGVDGLAHDINVRQNLDPGLDLSAVEAVQQWHFAPGTLKGEPVAVEAVIEINFKLQ